jgi:hypothetical protein
MIDMYYKQARILAEGYTWDEICDELLARYVELGFTTVNAYGEVFETGTQAELDECVAVLRTWSNV